VQPTAARRAENLPASQFTHFVQPEVD